MLENDEGRDLAAYDQYADQVLRRINVRYEHFTDRGVLGKVKVVNLEPGANAAWIRNKEKASGTSVSTIKPVRCWIPMKRKRFSGHILSRVKQMPGNSEFDSGCENGRIFICPELLSMVRYGRTYTAVDWKEDRCGK